MQIPMIYSPQRERNLDRLGEHPDTCLSCGKRTKATLWVHLLTTGEITDQAEHPDSQGSFPIGPDCAKKIPSNFIAVEIF